MTKRKASTPDVTAEPVIDYKYTIPVRAKPSPHDNFMDAWLSEPTQEVIVTPEEAKRRTAMYFLPVKPGRYVRAFFKDGGRRMIHEEWIEQPKAAKVKRNTKRDKEMAALVADTQSASIPRHRQKELKAKEAIALLTPVIIKAEPVKPVKPPRKVCRVLRSV